MKPSGFIISHIWLQIIVMDSFRLMFGTNLDLIDNIIDSFRYNEWSLPISVQFRTPTNEISWG